MQQTSLSVNKRQRSPAFKHSKCGTRVVRWTSRRVDGGDLHGGPSGGCLLYIYMGVVLWLFEWFDGWVVYRWWVVFGWGLPMHGLWLTTEKMRSQRFFMWLLGQMQPKRGDIRRLDQASRHCSLDMAIRFWNYLCLYAAFMGCETVRVDKSEWWFVIKIGFFHVQIILMGICIVWK